MRSYFDLIEMVRMRLTHHQMNCAPLVLMFEPDEQAGRRETFQGPASRNCLLSGTICSISDFLLRSLRLKTFASFTQDVSKRAP